ncbi:MAG: efflux RND transporter periplasmic adaptor subunit [Polyangiales bacterium]
MPASEEPTPAHPPQPAASGDRLVLPDTGKTTRRRRAVGFFLAAVAAASLAYALRPEEVPPELVRAEPVTRRTVVRVVEVSGHLDVRERLEVPAPMVGRLVAIDVSPGDTVHAGQSLAKLDEREASLAVGSARASVTAAASHVAGARVALEAAQADVDRLAHLVPRGLASEAELASARTRVSQAEAQLRAARAEQGVAATGLASAELGRDLGVLRSPVDGIVLHAPRSLGSLVGPERGPLFVIGVGLDDLRIDASVGEADIGEVKVGQTARFEVPAFLSRTFSATVMRIELAPDIDQGAVTYPVQFQTPNTDHALLPGMTAVLRIEVARAENVLSVREAALRFTPENAPDAPARSRVWKRTGPSTLVPVPVTVGVSDGAFTEIRPVNPGDLSEGTPIAIGMNVIEESAGAGLSLGGGRRGNGGR